MDEKILTIIDGQNKAITYEELFDKLDEEERKDLTKTLINLEKNLKIRVTNKGMIMTVSDFNIQQQLIASAEEALDLSVLAYHETKQRFIIGKADINSLTLSLNRQQQAQRNYISALQSYWLNYYKIRRLTLFDFAAKLSLSDRFDFNGGKLVK